MKSIPLHAWFFPPPKEIHFYTNQIFIQYLFYAMQRLKFWDFSSKTEFYPGLKKLIFWCEVNENKKKISKHIFIVQRVISIVREQYSMVRNSAEQECYTRVLIQRGVRDEMAWVSWGGWHPVDIWGNCISGQRKGKWQRRPVWLALQTLEREVGNKIKALGTRSPRTLM